MKYQKLGNSPLVTSVVSFGTWGLGGGSVWSDMTVTEKEVMNLLDHASDLGINYIDTAPVYGTGVSEELLGKALKGPRRDKFILQTKCSLNWRGDGGNFHYERDGYTVNNDTSAKAIKKDVEDSLLRMKTDWIDSLIVHYVCDSYPIEETVMALEVLREEGKIRTYGISNSKPETFEKYAECGSVAVVQEQYSILAPFHGMEYFKALEQSRTVFQVYGALEEGFLTDPAYVDRTFPAGDVRGKLPWIHEPIKGNIKKLFEVMTPLTEKYNCSYSNLIQAWTLKQFPRMNLLTGFRRVETMENTCKSLEINLSDSDAKLMFEAAKPAMVKELDK